MFRYAKNIMMTGATVFALLTTGVASAEPVMQSLIDQSTCNTSGFFYDHSKGICTSIKILACNDETLQILIKAKASNAEKWQAMHKQITKSGYEVSQCLQPRDHELVVNYVKHGLWPEFKTVRVLTH